MGLAASQARFLGITLRKANCEFRSTELAQQKLELTNQMTDISQDYANALNSTKLVWSNEAVCDSFGNPTDFGITYSLLMMPSAANDYNPYMLSTRTGAIVLDAKHAQAAKDAGISMAGGTPSQSGRDKFIASLANGIVTTASNGAVTSISYDTSKTDNVITSTTSDHITGMRVVDPLSDVAWHSSAGMGAVPKDKGVADIITLADLVADKNIGGKTIDWLQIYKAALGIEAGITEVEYESEMGAYKDAIAMAKLRYINYTDASGSSPYDSTYVNNVLKTAASEVTISSSGVSIASDSIMAKFKKLDDLINSDINQTARIQYQNELELLKQGYETIQTPSGRVQQYLNNDEESALKCPLYWSVYEQAKAQSRKSAAQISWNTSNNTYDNNSVSLDMLFYTGGDGIGGGDDSSGNKGIDIKSIAGEKAAVDYLNILTLCTNNIIEKNATNIKNMTIADLLTENVSIIAQKTDDNAPINAVSTAAKAILYSVASTFGYGKIGTGLNVDAESNSALEMALAMTEKKYLKPGNAVKGTTGSNNDNALINNGAYIAAQDYNRIGVSVAGDYEAGDYACVNLSNMISAFLTYYDNFLRGTESQYVVGRGNTDGKTIFVTDDPRYAYIANHQDGLTNDEKIADFYNELYNNICEHGWRQDEIVKDSEYLESAIKDGRYQIMALNTDGYYYQSRYNDLGYMQEVQDQDAIARAEADYTTKKAKITFKEDQIDIKTKKLDAEITELNTEINSVQNIISKSIEKTFSMFSN